MSPQHAPRGYVAIVSAIILSAILTALASTESTGVFWTRFSQLDALHHAESGVEANSCMYEAVVAFAEDPDVRTPAVLSFPDAGSAVGTVCSLEKILPSASGVTIYVASIVSGTRVILASTVTKSQDSSSSLRVTSWREVPNVPP